MNQRFLELSFSGGSGSYNVTTPADGGQCPPGHYLLFVINNVGVPSAGKMIQVLPSSAPEVAMICPANHGIVQPGNIKVSAEVKDSTTVQRVDFYEGNTLIGQVQTSQADGRHYAITWNKTTLGQYSLKATAIKASTQVDSPQTTVTIHSFPDAPRPTLSPTVTLDGDVYPYYSFPVTISTTATAPDSGAYIAQMDIYEKRADQLPVQLIRRTANSASPTSFDYTWPQAHSGTSVSTWAIALDNFGCETFPIHDDGGRNDVVNFKIYGGALDTSFAPSADGIVYAVAAQSDGKVLIGGDFTTVGGTTHNRIARLNTDGSPDNAFNPNVNGTVKSIVIQTDGKIILGGSFTTVGTTTRNGIARLDSDGTLNSFDPNANGTVNAIIKTSDEILMAGSFTTVGGVSHKNIARFTADVRDDNFAPDINGAINAVAKSGTQILIGGAFTAVGGTTRNRIARLDAGGSLDSTFDPNANNVVNAIAVRAVSATEDEFFIGGAFTTLGGGTATRNRIARIASSGSLDATFQNGLGGADLDVSCIAVQTDGKIVIGGGFSHVNGATRNRIARLLLTNGALDDDFREAPGPDLADYGPDSVVSAIALDLNNLIIIGGDFASYNYSLNGQNINATRHRIARLGGL